MKPMKVKDATKEATIESARRVLGIEADAVRAILERLDDGLDESFTAAVETVLAATGKVVVTGMGKSGLICQKIASTLASTGTSSFFLHPAEGGHGDLGVLMKNDVLLAVSNSGETEEIIKMVPAVKRMGIKLIAMTGKKKSTLGGYADIVLDIGVKEEACPLGLAPTASTTTALAMGDALAVALLERRGFREEDFATLHPAGNLGKKLMKVGELMHTGADMPRVEAGTSMKAAIIEMTAKRLGIAGVFEGKRLAGVITDGDLRRSLEKGDDLLNKRVEDVMGASPKTISKSAVLEAALNLMEEHSITALFVTHGEDSDDVAGVIHLHDLIRAGVI
jgi:arabinose-5-phosphate isomerase